MDISGMQFEPDVICSLVLHQNETRSWRIKKTNCIGEGPNIKPLGFEVSSQGQEEGQKFRKIQNLGSLS
jgi:hypothetical protein